MDLSYSAFRSSPNVIARLAGFFYLIIIVLGVYTELFVRGKLIISGDAVATAQNILNAEMLWRLGIAGGILLLLFAVALALIFYIIFRPVNQKLALMAAFFNLVAISIEAMSKLYLVEGWAILEKSTGASSEIANALYIQAYDTINMHSEGLSLSLIFFGINCLLWGFLIYRSGFLPRILGILLVICCFCYVFHGFAWFLNPSFAGILFPGIFIPCFIAETAFCLWLLVKGVDAEKWASLN